QSPKTTAAMIVSPAMGSARRGLSCGFSLAAVLTGHNPCPPGDWVNLARHPERKSPAQVFDQAVESWRVLLFDARHARKARRPVAVAIGFSGGDRLLVPVDPVISKTAALGEQTQKVLGLTVIRRLGRSSGGIDITRGRVHGQRR